MGCFINGVPEDVGGGGGAVNMLYDAVESPFSTSSVSYVTVPGSLLSVPAGTWAIDHSIEIAGDEFFSSVAGAQFYNLTDATQITSVREPLEIDFGYSVHGGVFHVTLASPKDFIWQFRLVSGFGPVYVRRARIRAIEEV